MLPENLVDTTRHELLQIPKIQIFMLKACGGKKEVTSQKLSFE